MEQNHEFKWNKGVVLWSLRANLILGSSRKNCRSCEFVEDLNDPHDNLKYTHDAHAEKETKGSTFKRNIKDIKSE